MNDKTTPQRPSSDASTPTTLKDYTSKVFKESSVGYVAGIALAISPWRKCFKVLVLFICLSGFISQSVKFLTVVFTYPTSVSIDIETSESFINPAYTFCDNNEIKRSLYCDKYPDRCIEADESFCLKYHSYCGDNHTKVPRKEYYSDVRELSLEEMVELNSNFVGGYIDYKTGHALNLSGPHLRPRNLYNQEYLLLCYSWNDLVDSPLTPATGRRLSFFQEFLPSTKIIFNVSSYETFVPGSRAGVLFSIHSPFDAVNPFMNGMFLKAGRQYIIYIWMEEQVLMTGPYDTNCTNYTKIWEERGRKGPRSQKMCKHKCGTDITTTCLNCSMPYFLYPSKKGVCKKELDQNSSDEKCRSMENVFFKCVEKCRDDCHYIEYKYEVQERDSPKFGYGGSVLNNTDQKTIVEIYLEQDEVRVLKHSPKYMMIEVFSTIGGFVGGWLGISLLDVTDIFEGFFWIFRYSIKRRPASSVPGPQSTQKIETG